MPELPMPFPFGGLTKDRGYQSSDPQTARDADNVAPSESAEARMRGGSRPGLTRYYPSQALTKPPLFIDHVSAGENDEAPEYVIVGTPNNMYIGESVQRGTTVPYSYENVLAPISGELCTQAGVIINTQTGNTVDINGNAISDVPIVIADYDFSLIDRSMTTPYKGTLIIAPEENEFYPDGAPINATVTWIDNPTPAADEYYLDDVAALFTTIGIDPAIHWIQVTSKAAATPPSEALIGTYKVTEIISDTRLRLNRAPTSDLNPSPRTENIDGYRIEVGVRVVDPVARTITLLEPTGGAVPTGCDVIITYKDRLTWGCGRNWIMSRIGDPGDYDYFSNPEDPARAIAGNASDAGQPADPIVALAKAGYDYLIIFAEQSTWIMRGDPGYGGQLYNLSQNVGCVGPKAWCNGASTEVYFLGKEGLYAIPPNVGSDPQAISQKLLPRDLRGTDRVNFDVTLAYEPEDDGVIMMVTPIDNRDGLSHFLFDIATGSFWPVSFVRKEHQGVDGITFGGNPLEPKRAIFVCKDGYVRAWAGSTDDSYQINSHVVLGPFPTSASSAVDGLITELIATLDEQTGPVTIEIYLGRSAEESQQNAIDASAPDWTQVLLPGRSWTYRPRKREKAFCVRLSSSDQWAYEGIFARLEEAGRVRR